MGFFRRTKERLKAGVISPRMKTIERPARVVVQAAVIPEPATSKVAMPPSAGHASATEVTTTEASAAEMSATEVSAADPTSDVTAATSDVPSSTSASAAAAREGIGRESGTAHRCGDSNNSDSPQHGFPGLLHIS
jgi:hypothetical protein